MRLRCADPDCEQTCKERHWGIEAYDLGWFLQDHGKEQKSWCPKHVPEWVKQWRRRTYSE